MLIPHPAVLRNALDAYEAARAAETTNPAPGSVPGRRVQDIAYTLCVLTNTRDVTLARQAARRLLAVRTTPVADLPRPRTAPAAA
ncbi:DUF5133 domain-containing protein [Streptomyces sp. NPDC091279]|uniref:DUF5133 domain-containing protein n=1 Tax=unclassified Streptomyces TaxID=2593676 RepID=UPI00381CDEFD